MSTAVLLFQTQIIISSEDHFLTTELAARKFLVDHIYSNTCLFTRVYIPKNKYELHYRCEDRRTKMRNATLP